MNGSCSFARFIKYIKTDLPQIFHDLVFVVDFNQNNILFFGISYLREDSHTKKYSQISGNFILNQFPST